MNSVKNYVLILFISLSFHSCSGQKHDYPIVPLPFNKVTLEDDFWQPRMVAARDVTVPFSLDNGQTAIDRLKVCGDFLSGKSDSIPKSHRYISSDLYKCMEGAAYSLMHYPDKALEERLDNIIDIIGGAMEDDGYLYVSHSCGNPKHANMGETPYSWVVHSHEVYNMGHMYEGAVAYYEATGKDKWLKLAEKSAQHINRVFFEGGDPKYNNGKPVMQAPGHEEIELALCKLYRATGNDLYLKMAKKFLDIRGVTYKTDGERVMSATYAQQHAPVKDQREPAGHAVRAGYLYTAMADVDALTGKTDYVEALDAIWSNLVNTRMHITGGLGAGGGIEGFEAEYNLPNRDAYNETCAACANVFLNFRLFLLHQDAKYLDIAELSLFNNALAGINLKGNRFFYQNPLESDGIKTFNKTGNQRVEWFGTACCPPNISRLILQTPGYMYSHTDDRIYCTLYASSKAEVPLKNGVVMVSQKSEYPFDGKVLLTLNPAKDNQSFEICLRIPTWASDGNFVPSELYSYKNKLNKSIGITVNGKPVDYRMEKGFAVIDGKWKKGDKVELNLPMDVRFIDCHPAVEANIGRLAVTRGPLVYCVEGADNKGGQVQRFFMSENPNNVTVSKFNEGILRGIPKITIPAKEISGKDVKNYNLTMIPYYSWNNRELSNTMQVWMPDTYIRAANSIPGYWYLESIEKISASYCSNKASVTAICDAGVPASSEETKISRWTSIPEYGKKQWVEVEFKELKDLKTIAVYWSDRSTRNEKTKVPKSWNVEYRMNGKWQPLKIDANDSFGVHENQFNVIHPDKQLKCNAVKFNITPHDNYAVGILETQFSFVE
jgi:hypothetical protein